MNITAEILFDYTQCPHRVWRDVNGPQDEKIDEKNPFVELLWKRGVQFEKEVIKEIGKFTDLSTGKIDERAKQTIEAMKRGDFLIYQGVLKYGDLAGIPDLLKKLDNGFYIPIDIKAGRGFEGVSEDSEGKPKKHYAVQLCLYVEALKHLGFADQNRGIIIDINKNEVEYLLDEKTSSTSRQSWWELYEEIKQDVRALIENKKQNFPANASMCKLCPWYNSCKQWCKENHDLTNVFYLGRSGRDTIKADLGITTIEELCSLDISEAIRLKKERKGFLNRIGKTLLQKFVKRADIVSNKKSPVVYEKINFPEVSIELFFDIEADPTQDIVYLHGFYVREDGKEEFIYFFADDNSEGQEQEAWKRSWEYIRKLPQGDFAVYYYSPYEKTAYKNMSTKYPGIVSEDKVIELFDNPNVIDLYKEVQKKSDWPLASYSLKDIATFLGFKWRDETPSGALSIQWYNEYLNSKNPEIKKRILEYNEDDCKATMLLKDKLVALQG